METGDPDPPSFLLDWGRPVEGDKDVTWVSCCIQPVALLPTPDTLMQNLLPFREASQIHFPADSLFFAVSPRGSGHCLSSTISLVLSQLSVSLF